MRECWILLGMLVVFLLVDSSAPAVSTVPGYPGIPLRISMKSIISEVERLTDRRESDSDEDGAPRPDFWDVYNGDQGEIDDEDDDDVKPWMHTPIQGLTADPVATAVSGDRSRKFSSLRKMIEWYMSGEKARKRSPIEWKVVLRGAEASSAAGGGAGVWGEVWIPPPFQSQTNVGKGQCATARRSQAPGEKDDAEPNSGDASMLDSMSPMRLSGGGVGGSTMRLRGGMRLFTHNILSSPALGAEVTFPLGIQDATAEIVPCEFDPVMVKALLPKVDWPALAGALRSIGGAAAIGLASELPGTRAEAERLCGEDDESTLRALHRVLVEVHVVEAALVCPSTGRRFRVQDGIPNLLSAPPDTSGG